ncbi:MAG: methyltransferase domain-containing protein [Propionivibrio sp.]
MLPPALKQRVRDAFDRAAVTYDAAAVVQRRVCDHLLENLKDSAAAPARIVDAGCGTGYGARCLRSRYPAAHITGVNFAPSMLEIAAQATDVCLAADIEKLPLDDRSFDLWWSSLTIQWCATPAVFAEAARVLKPAGRLALSTLGPGTFRELREAFSGIDRHRHTLPFSEPGDIAAALENAGFSDITLLREQHVVELSRSQDAVARRQGHRRPERRRRRAQRDDGPPRLAPT